MYLSQHIILKFYYRQQKHRPKSGSSMPSVRKPKKQPKIRNVEPKKEESDQEQEDYGDLVSSSEGNMSVEEGSDSSSDEDSLDEDMMDILGEFCRK